MTEYLEGLDPNDIRNILNRMESRLAAVEQATLDVNQLADITPETGDIEFRAVDDEGRLRLILSAIDIFDEHGIHAHFAGFDVEGQPQFWLSADDGSGAFGGGLVTLSAEGMIVDGVGLPVKFIARDGSGDLSRIGTIGMVPYGGDSALALEFRDTDPSPTNLVEDIEDFTGSGTGVTWDVYQIDLNPVELRATKTGTGSGEAESDQFAVTEGETYEVKLKGGKVSGAGLIQLSIEWYDDPSAGSSLGSTVISSTTAGSATVLSGAALAPSGAEGARVVVTVTFTDAGETIFFFLWATVYAITISSQFLLGEGGASLNVGLSISGYPVPVTTDRRWMVPQVSDFLNPPDSFTEVAIAAGTIASINGESGHPGIRRISSVAAGNTGYAVFFSGLSSPLQLIDTPAVMECVIRPRLNSSQFRMMVGFRETLGTAASPTGAYFDFTGLVATPTVNAGTLSTYTLTVDTWYRLRVRYLAHPTHPAVNFSIYDMNGDLLYSNTLIIGVPTSLTNRVGVGALRTGATASALVEIDWGLFYMSGLAR